MDELPTKPFVCDYQKCNAKCCRNIKGNIDDDSILEQNNERYMHIAVPLKELSIAISNHEKEVLSQIAQNKGFKLKLVPQSFVLTKHFEPIIINWQLDYDTCPFLNNKNECDIYEHRPLVCKSFPYLKRFEVAPFCTSAIELRDSGFGLKGNNMGEIYVYATIQQTTMQLYAQLIAKLIQNKEVRLFKTSRAINKLKEYKGTLKTIESFLIDKGLADNKIFKKQSRAGPLSKIII